MTCNPDQGFHPTQALGHLFAVGSLKYPSDLCDEPATSMTGMTLRCERANVCVYCT